MAVSTLDIAWFAGIMEGEGTFTKTRGNRDHAASPSMQLCMTDEDVVARAAKLLNCHYIQSAPRQPNRKLIYRFQIGGPHAIGWMQTIYPLMGIRRKARIRDVIATWLAAPGKPKLHHYERYMRNK